MEFQGSALTALALTTFAGLSTGIGSAFAYFSKKTNKAFLSVSLGFSAGVMIFVSFAEIMLSSKSAFAVEYADKIAEIYSYLGFFVGLALILIIDKLIPSYENPHEPKLVEAMSEEELSEKKLLRMGLLTALAIGIHNFPEGMATFTAALSDSKLGISIAVAIAIHNIPEGIAVSVPIFYATQSKKKAFWLSFSSGLAEPAGAAIGYLILKPFLSPFVLGFLFAAVAGIMVFISLDELLPAAREYGSGHNSIYGLVAGMLVMAISLSLF